MHIICLKSNRLAVFTGDQGDRNFGGGTMYSIYRQVHPVTGIESAVYCNLIDPVVKSLVIGGVNYLHIYHLNSDTDTSSSAAILAGNKGQEKEKSQDVKSRRMKLECVASFSLFGNVYSMQSVRIAGSPLDSLLLSFKDAKLSMLDYDPGTHDLKASSLHYFEDEELKDGRCQQIVNQPLVRVDTDGRCAAMLIYGNRLVVLPFRREISPADPSMDGLVCSNSSPVQSSYIIELRKLDERVCNIIDFQFLYGYHEPTVVLLYEPLPTWAGRIAMRKDSCCIIALSLNLEQKVHPIIWSLSNLPFDCCQLFSVPKPIGGVLVFAVNSLIYLNQSFPPFGVSLNSIANISSDFMLKTQEGIRITLDCAQAAFISPEKLVVSLKGGELYVLTLMTDAMRAVRSFNMDKAAASVLTTCMCVCDDGFIFLGSRLGNSLLLKYTEKTTAELVDNSISADSKKERTDEPATKKRKLVLDDWLTSSIDDLDELEVYGSEANQSGSQVTQYTFEVCDSIVNIGPCGQTVMGEPAFLSEEFNTSEPDIELVTTSGYGKNGAISVLQRSIRPQIVTTFELPGCTDMWTITGEEQQEDEDNETETEPEEEHTHTLLILSRQDSSMVLKTGQEIMELDHSGFSTQGATIYAGNIGNNAYILQVSAMGVRLLQGVKQLQHIPVDVGSPIVCCSVADPHIMIMSKQGHIIQLMLKPDKFGTGSGARLAISKPSIAVLPKIVTLCTYKDESGLFTTSTTTEQVSAIPRVTEPPPTPTISTSLEPPLPFDKTSIDDEEELLYGVTSIPKTDAFVKKPEERASGKTIPVKETAYQPTFWVALCRENGVLEIYSLPEMRQCYLLKNFPIGHRVLVDSFLSSSDPRQGNQEKVNVLQEMPVVHELLMVGLGSKRSRPYLMARLSEELLIYEAFPYHFPPVIENNLKIRFKKVNQNISLRLQRRYGVAARENKDAMDDDDEETWHLNWLRPFDDISGYSGVFLCGPKPHWMFMTSRGILRIHPMNIDGAVTCFTPFHNVNCPKGFLFFNGKGELRIAVLPGHLAYDAPWPVRKVPLRCTPYYLAYHMDSKTYGVATATAEPSNRLIKSVGDGDKEFENLEKDDRFVFPLVEKFSVQLFSPISWEAIPNSRYELEEFERVTCMQTIDLRSEGTVSGLKGYIVCGTNFAYGEDITSHGRVIILDVIEVVPEPGMPLTKNKFKVEYDKEQKGAVSAIAGVQGFLVTAIGQKIYIWQLKEGGLRGVAFIDAQIYVHSICTIKSLILIGDVYKSITLLRYQEDMKVLSLVSRDIRPSEVYSIAFLVNNQDLNFLVADRNKNLLVYSYLPEVRESNGGQRLIQRADINIGSNINCFFRICCKKSDPIVDVKSIGVIDNKHVTYFTTLDGSIGYLLPINEKTYRRLLMLQNTLNSHLSHLAGLNPKAYRSVQCDMRHLSNPHRGILDGDLLWKFFHLSLTERKDVARRIGTTVEQMINDLSDLDRLTDHF